MFKIPQLGVVLCWRNQEYQSIVVHYFRYLFYQSKNETYIRNAKDLRDSKYVGLVTGVDVSYNHTHI